MSSKKNNKARGVITFHTLFPVSMWKSEECRADARDATGRRGSLSLRTARTRSPGKCARAGKRDEASPSGPQPGAKQDWLSHTSLRRLKAKMEAENQQAKEITQPLLDTENGFMKDLEMFLSHRDVTELRRRELLHKRWTERVWFPLQRRVEEHVSSCSPAAVKRRQSLYSHYLHHCNTKGSVFLDTYDLREYDPLLLHVKKPHSFKVKEFFAMPRTDILRQASSNHPVTPSTKPPVGDETEGRRSSRLDTIPYHISATAAPDGRCHQTGCWLLRYGPQQASRQQLQSSPTSK